MLVFLLVAIALMFTGVMTAELMVVTAKN